MAVDVEHFLRPERVGPVQVTERGLRAELGGEQVQVDVLAPDVVRLAVSRGGRFDPRPTHALVVDPGTLGHDVPVEVTERDGRWTVRAPGVTVSLHTDPFRLDVHRPDGTPVQRSATDADGRAWSYAWHNDAFLLRRIRAAEDSFYGLGEKSGRFDRAGREYTQWSIDVLNPTAAGEFERDADPGTARADRTSTDFDPFYVGVPLLYHHRADGTVSASFVDNAYRAHYDLRDRHEWSVRFDGGQYCEYVFAGPSLPGILEAFTALTGRAPLPPRWALGHHQSRWKNYGERDVVELAREFRRRDIPLDALWLDIDHMDGYRVFTWNRDLFPDPARLTSHLADEHVRLVTIVDPGVKHETGYAVYDDAVGRDVLCRTESGEHYVGQVWPGDTVFPDFATGEARAWWAEQNARHVACGVAGIWNDMNEPATGVVPPGAMRFEHGRAPHERYHNQFALLMAMATRDGLLAARPDERTFILSRSGFAGIQRYAANWMGDNLSRWDHLWMSIPMAMGFGLSGQPFVGADVGGFSGDTEAELLLRWYQYAAFTPFFRNHNAIYQRDQYAWSFGALVEDGVREAIRLRYRLMPYLYTAFATASRTGEPVQRPLVFDHQYDDAVRGLDDEFLCGRDLLVAPVHEPGLTSRAVYLPVGEWYDWHTGQYAGGGQWVIAPTPRDRIPVYARAGAVIPTWPDVPDAVDGYRAEAVRLMLFVPHADGETSSVLHEDDGRSLADGYLRTLFTVTRRGDVLTVAAETVGDGFAAFARERFELVVCGATPRRAVSDGAEVDAVDGVITLANRGTDLRVDMTVD